MKKVLKKVMEKVGPNVSAIEFNNLLNRELQHYKETRGKKTILTGEYV